MKSVMEQEQIHKKHETNTQFLIVWSIAATIVVVMLGFYGWKSWRLNEASQEFELSIKNTQQQLQQLAPGNTEQFLRKQQEIAQKAEKNRINWSNIMEQITELESSMARFSSINVSGEIVSASCQTTSWNSFTEFIKSLKADPRISNVRISSTATLSPSLAGASQTAELTFHFSPTNNENE